MTQVLLIQVKTSVVQGGKRASELRRGSGSASVGLMKKGRGLGCVDDGLCPGSGQPLTCSQVEIRYTDTFELLPT